MQEPCKKLHDFPSRIVLKEPRKPQTDLVVSRHLDCEVSIVRAKRITMKYLSVRFKARHKANLGLDCKTARYSHGTENTGSEQRMESTELKRAR